MIDSSQAEFVDQKILIASYSTTSRVYTLNKNEGQREEEVRFLWVKVVLEVYVCYLYSIASVGASDFRLQRNADAPTGRPYVSFH